MEKESNGTTIHALSRDDILAQTRRRIIKVDVPEWGGFVFVKEMSGTERDAYELSQLQGRTNNKPLNLVNARAKLVMLTTVDEAGKMLFTRADVDALGKTSAKALTRIFKVASDLSGLTDEDMEELTEAMGEGQPVGSGSN